MNNDGDTERTRGRSSSPRTTDEAMALPVLPPTSSPMSLQSQVFTIRVHEDDDARPVGRCSAPVSGTSSRTVGVPVSMADDIMLVVGRAGWDCKSMQNPISNIARVPSQNERTQIINAGVDQLPDRWQGLGMVSTIVWADASPKNSDATGARSGVDRAWRSTRHRAPGDRRPLEFSSSLRNNLLGITESTDRTSCRRQLPEDRPGRGPKLMQVLSKTATLRNPDARLTIRLFEKASLVAPGNPSPRCPGSIR